LPDEAGTGGNAETIEMLTEQPPEPATRMEGVMLPCRIEYDEAQNRVCMACGGIANHDLIAPVDCPHAPCAIEPPDAPDWGLIQVAALLLALCIGASTYNYVNHRIEMEKAQVAPSPLPAPPSQEGR
jgi:hypothetical protein